MSETINTLDELLNDPMIQLVMASDRVRPAEIRLLLERARDRVGDDPRVDQASLPPAHMVARSCLKQWLYR
ncbi:hypothetical protein FJ987_23710 [Mesorhizobium sp. CU2]|uniref:hypothetical protein n=1 Tax=unclassified Mesorhizobium TaxID=325217 RepID=UPI00112E1569|nr:MULTISPECIES: hypothetical protein [unclassified Mesorhizobium]TPN88262.1 hypothetical protein FJ988_04215 [Mesorhizobium sp. CU3]TPO08111.1 hypothetical protein FJ987_23710 [Mesorhizobium sp. CU2]